MVPIKLCGRGSREALSLEDWDSTIELRPRSGAAAATRRVYRAMSARLTTAVWRRSS